MHVCLTSRHNIITFSSLLNVKNKGTLRKLCMLSKIFLKVFNFPSHISYEYLCNINLVLNAKSCDYNFAIYGLLIVCG